MWECRITLRGKLYEPHAPATPRDAELKCEPSTEREPTVPKVEFTDPPVAPPPAPPQYERDHTLETRTFHT